MGPIDLKEVCLLEIYRKYVRFMFRNLIFKILAVPFDIHKFFKTRGCLFSQQVSNLYNYLDDFTNWPYFRPSPPPNVPFIYGDHTHSKAVAVPWINPLRGYVQHFPSLFKTPCKSLNSFYISYCFSTRSKFLLPCPPKFQPALVVIIFLLHVISWETFNIDLETKMKKDQIVSILM